MVRTMNKEDLADSLSIQWGCVDGWLDGTRLGDVLDILLVLYSDAMTELSLVLDSDRQTKCI
jgi:hypothetical protein